MGTLAAKGHAEGAISQGTRTLPQTGNGKEILQLSQDQMRLD